MLNEPHKATGTGTEVNGRLKAATWQYPFLRHPSRSSLHLGSPHPWLARQDLGVLAGFAHQGDVCGLVLHTRTNSHASMVLDTPIKDEMQGSQPWHWGMQALKEEENWVWQASPGGQECSYCSRCNNNSKFQRPACLPGDVCLGGDISVYADHSMTSRQAGTAGPWLLTLGLAAAVTMPGIMTRWLTQSDCTAQTVSSADCME